MGKKKKFDEDSMLIEDEEVENTLVKKAEEKLKSMKAKETLLKPSEWARQDSDRPDPHLFLWHDAQGVIPEAQYNELKTKVFRKKR